MRKYKILAPLMFSLSLALFAFGVIETYKQQLVTLTGSSNGNSHTLSWNIDASQPPRIVQLQRQDAPNWKKLSVIYQQTFSPAQSGTFTNQLLTPRQTKYRVQVRTTTGATLFSNEITIQ